MQGGQGKGTGGKRRGGGSSGLCGTRRVPDTPCGGQWVKPGDRRVHIGGGRPFGGCGVQRADRCGDAWEGGAGVLQADPDGCADAGDERVWGHQDHTEPGGPGALQGAHLCHDGQRLWGR